jgi:transcriptional regulator with XRE-family HTH domain
MSSPKKGITPEQLAKVADKVGLTTAAIAEGTGISKAYISEFRNGKRKLMGSHPRQLLAYIESVCKEHGCDIPEVEDTSSSDLVNGLGNLVQHVNRPAIMLNGDLPKDQVSKLLNLIDTNRIKATELLSTKFEAGGVLGGDFSTKTQECIQEFFALASLNYLAILLLQGHNIAQRRSSEIKHQTVGDWLSSHLSASPLADHLPDSVEVEPAREEA